MLKLKKRGFILTLIVVILLLSGLIGTAFAQGIGEQGGDMMVPAEKSINDDYFAMGKPLLSKGGLQAICLRQVIILLQKGISRGYYCFGTAD